MLGKGSLSALFDPSQSLFRRRLFKSSVLESLNHRLAEFAADEFVWTAGGVP